MVFDERTDTVNLQQSKSAKTLMGNISERDVEETIDKGVFEIVKEEEQALEEEFSQDEDDEFDDEDSEEDEDEQ